MNRWLGAGAGLLLTVALAAAMAPLRAHLSPAVSALVLVIPVVASVTTGGFAAGLATVVLGFVTYDLVFIQPYWTLTVADAQDWVALGVFVVVMVLVARVVARLKVARQTSEARERYARDLVGISELLMEDKPLPELGRAVVEHLRETFSLSGAALLLSVDGRLEVVASTGSASGNGDIELLGSRQAVHVALSSSARPDETKTLALVAAGRPVGLVVLHHLPDHPVVHEVLPVVANHLALALEQVQLRELLIQMELLKATDRLRRALFGAVSHDLRTPLATIKFASSTLMDCDARLSPADAAEMCRLIDAQADRLTRLVDNLLDMSRIEAGALELNRAPLPLSGIIGKVVAEVEPTLEGQRIAIAGEIPDVDVDVDPVLVEQVLANLLENGHHHSLGAEPLELSAARVGPDEVQVAVTDHGPGIPREERAGLFLPFVRSDSLGAAGLGLAIAKAFVEAHGGEIWVEDPPGGGARMAFTLQLATSALVGH